MRYDFKCTDINCKNKDIVVEVVCTSKNLDKNKECKLCGKEMNRIWTVPSVKTGDGYKG